MDLLRILQASKDSVFLRIDCKLQRRDRETEPPKGPTEASPILFTYKENGTLRFAAVYAN